MEVASAVKEEQQEERGKWRWEGLRDMELDCPVEVVWELFSDWVNSGRWYSPPDKCELVEGKNRQPGCVLLVKYPSMWLHERIVLADQSNFLFSYAIEGNDVCGGMKGFKGTVQFRGMGEGKTLVLYWKYEVEPVENQTMDAFFAFVDPVFRAILSELVIGAQKVAAGVDLKPVKPATPIQETTEGSSTPTNLL